VLSLRETTMVFSADVWGSGFGSET
jgi:hypothetical protein